MGVTLRAPRRLGRIFWRSPKTFPTCIYQPHLFSTNCLNPKALKASGIIFTVLGDDNFSNSLPAKCGGPFPGTACEVPSPGTCNATLGRHGGLPKMRDALFGGGSILRPHIWGNYPIGISENILQRRQGTHCLPCSRPQIVGSRANCNIGLKALKEERLPTS